MRPIAGNSYDDRNIPWGIKVSSQPTEGSKDTVRKVQFGDGYAQVSGSGLNDEIRTYEYSFSGSDYSE